MPVRYLKPRRFGDTRGWFSETYVRDRWAAAGVDTSFIQDNHSFSAAPGTVRGIHFQRPPHAQAKLVRCTRGAVMDYAVDLRAGSPTFGRHVGAELSADNGHQLYIPVGFGHAFVTLTPDVEIVYKVSDVYAPDCDGGVRWDDPDIGIDWPLPPHGATLSDKDARLPRLRDFDSPFAYDGAPLEPLGEPIQV
ncbi:dTDP-4-dehydrorhamnose 3,5-epimerase [Brevundimonas balnearis]|uniref:dTDP-4-dehydrorhamnose 3,5-epimerase n=1 Tax=Brevundimonas balnearis TaxID=1572858 RepID=A0ABV6R187_9CAUL